jgi:hypothetical protein
MQSYTSASILLIKHSWNSKLDIQFNTLFWIFLIKGCVHHHDAEAGEDPHFEKKIQFNTLEQKKTSSQIYVMQPWTIL